MQFDRWKRVVEGIGGVALGAIGTVVLISAQLLIVSNFTQNAIIGGGLFGILVGVSAALLAPVGSLARRSPLWRAGGIVLIVAVGLAGTWCTQTFNGIVSADSIYTGMQLHLSLLAFGTFVTLFFVTTSMMTLLELAFPKSP